MKNILIIIMCFCITFCLTSSSKKQNLSELDTFTKENNIDIVQIEPYLKYKRFNFLDYFELEKIRIKYKYSYLETINHFYSKNNAVFENTNIILVNKNHFLTKSYKPTLISIDDYPVKVTKYNMEIKKEVLLSYLQMIDDLELDDLYIFSSYRSYERQMEIYNKATDLSYVAYPGTSEHQTGLVIDISTLNYGLITHFDESREFKILISNCHYYGFILRYPKGKESLTGYSYEPWHFRFVGRESATYIMTNNLTLEEYIYQNFEI
ncbi:MAG: M15 family metallopeptidase [Bacilli bacterium]|nr:M15 family metallopeptidase [Acholeplasmataceae bacterium]MDY2902392.1 M15 family metallopeptidase [Bacilli bacterium]